MAGKYSRFTDDVRINPDTLDDKDGMVTCSMHHTRRKAVYCERIPVLNAAKEVISYLFQCTKQNECSSSWRRGGGRVEEGNHNPSSSLDLFSGVLDCSSSSLSKAIDGRKVADTSHVTARPQGKDSEAMDSKNTRKPKVLINKESEELTSLLSLNSTNNNNNTTDNHNKGTLKTPTDTVLSSEAGEGALEKADKLPTQDNSECVKAFTPSELVNLPSTTRPALGSGSTLISPLGAATSTPSVATATMGGGNRYFELLEKGPRGGTLSTGQYGGDFLVSKKVCWNCGLLGHEKPSCINTLCRSCHAIKWCNMESSRSSPRHPLPHTCLPVPLSEFVVPLLTLPANVPLGLSETECIRCGERGHLDCSSSLSSSYRPNMLSCCYCGRTGHTAYDCSTRESEQPDRWIQRMLWQKPQQQQPRTHLHHSNDSYSRSSREYSTPRSYRSSSHYSTDPYSWNEKGDEFRHGIRETDRSPWMSSSSSFRSYSQSSHFNDQERASSRNTGAHASYHRHSSSIPSSYHRHSSRSGTEQTSHSPHDLNSFSSSRSRSAYERKRFRSELDEELNRRNRYTKK